jgi:hypothetical protein
MDRTAALADPPGGGGFADLCALRDEHSIDEISAEHLGITVDAVALLLRLPTPLDRQRTSHLIRLELGLAV